MSDMKFTWDPEHEDSDIANNGIIVAWLDAGRAAIDNFVAELSYKIDAKCDWSYMGGKAHVDTLPENFNAAQEAMMDEDWMKSFIVPFDDITHGAKRWFTGWKLTVTI